MCQLVPQAQPEATWSLWSPWRRRSVKLWYLAARLQSSRRTAAVYLKLASMQLAGSASCRPLAPRKLAGRYTTDGRETFWEASVPHLLSCFPCKLCVTRPAIAPISAWQAVELGLTAVCALLYKMRLCSRRLSVIIRDSLPPLELWGTGSKTGPRQGAFT